MDLGDIIRQYRRSNHLSMRAFSRESGLTPAYISMLEAGKNSTTGRPPTPSATTISKVAGAMGIAPEELVKMVGGNMESEVIRPQSTTIEQSSYRTIPVYAYMRKNVSNVILKSAESKSIPVDASLNDPLATRIHHNAFPPYINAGDIVIIEQANRQPEGGGLVVCCDPGDNARIAWLVWINDACYEMPGTPNGQYKPFDASSVLGAVVEVRRQFKQ